MHSFGSAIPTYSRSEERHIGSFDAAIPFFLQSVMAHIVIEPDSDTERIELYGYGDARGVRGLDLDSDGLMTMVAGTLPYANSSSVQINNFGPTGNRSISALSIGRIDLGGSSGTIDGVSIEEYEKAKNGESDRYIMVDGRLIDKTRAVHLRMVVPTAPKKIKIAGSHGSVLVSDHLTGGELHIDGSRSHLLVGTWDVHDLRLSLKGKPCQAQAGRIGGVCSLSLSDGAAANINGTQFI